LGRVGGLAVRGGNIRKKVARVSVCTSSGGAPAAHRSPQVFLRRATPPPLGAADRFQPRNLARIISFSIEAGIHRSRCASVRSLVTAK